MSYCEYIDMFLNTQKKQCPYRAFTFDVVNSRNEQRYLNAKGKHFSFLDCVYSLLEHEEQKTGKIILLKDNFNRKQVLLDQTYNSKRKDVAVKNGNNYNPMILGDMVTFFVHNGSISSERMLHLFAEALRKFNINYSFHFLTGVYETNNYAEGGSKLYKGYMPQILENLSKKNNFVVTKNFNLEDSRIYRIN